MPDIKRINEQLQSRLLSECREEVNAVEAARWLDEQGILADRKDRPGERARFISGDFEGNRSALRAVVDLRGEHPAG